MAKITYHLTSYDCKQCGQQVRIFAVPNELIKEGLCAKCYEAKYYQGVSAAVKYKELTDRQRRNAILNLAYQYLTFKDCKKCGYPRVDGYCCSHCGTFNPDTTVKQDIEMGLKN